MAKDKPVSEDQASEAAPAAKKTPTEVQNVTMTDGRVVGFAGKRKVNKSTSVEGGVATVRFDFRNGETRLFTVPDSILLNCAAHGASQKIGDEYSGVDEVDDIVIAADSMIARLTAGEWSAARAEGDSFSGASIVIKAVCEASGKPVQYIKDFLQKKLDTAKAAGEKLSRADLYNSLRNPSTKTGQIIARLEAEKAAKSGSAVNGDSLLSELA